MKILVLGAAGKTGSEVVRQAIASGHEVTAFAHNAEKIQPQGARVMEGDSTNPADVDRAVQGQDAVLDAIGGGHKAFLDTDLESSTAKYVIESMKQHSVRRLIVISMLGEGDSGRNASFFYEHLLLPTYLRGAAKDKTAMEAAVQQSELDWVILRPAVLSDQEGTGEVQTYLPEDGKTAHSIARADVASFMLQQLASDEYLHQAVTIATR